MERAGPEGNGGDGRQKDAQPRPEIRCRPREGQGDRIWLLVAADI